MLSEGHALCPDEQTDYYVLSLREMEKDKKQICIPRAPDRAKLLFHKLASLLRNVGNVVSALCRLQSLSSSRRVCRQWLRQLQCAAECCTPHTRPVLLSWRLCTNFAEYIRRFATFSAHSSAGLAQLQTRLGPLSLPGTQSDDENCRADDGC